MLLHTENDRVEGKFMEFFIPGGTGCWELYPRSGGYGGRGRRPECRAEQHYLKLDATELKEAVSREQPDLIRKDIALILNLLISVLVMACLQITSRSCSFKTGTIKVILSCVNLAGSSLFPHDMLSSEQAVACTSTHNGGFGNFFILLFSGILLNHPLGLCGSSHGTAFWKPKFDDVNLKFFSMRVYVYSCSSQ